MLPAELKSLWTEYEAAEARAPRAQKIARLEAFVDQLQHIDNVEWAPWALDIARQYVDLGADFQIRMPLFRAAVFPTLKEALEQETPGAARWLAGLCQHLYRAEDCQSQLRPEYQTQIGLLRAAVQHDPHDEKSRTDLIDALAWQLQMAIHEVPSGVLYGHDGASIEQCEELQTELEAFSELVAKTDLAARYSGLIEECAYHFGHYQRYLADTSQYASYREYLAIVDPE